MSTYRKTIDRSRKFYYRRTWARD